MTVVAFAGSAWAQAPSLSGISPSNLTAGSQATLTGSGFGDPQGGGFVFMANARFVPVVSWSDTQIVVTVPSGISSGVAFVRQNGAWSNAIPFTVAGASPGLSSTPVNFGQVAIGSSGTMSETLTNTGGSSVRIYWVRTLGAGVAISGLTTPLDLAPSESATFQVTYSPSATGPLNGLIWIFSNAGFGPLTISLSGNGQAGSTGGGSESGPGNLSLTPATVSFGSVTVGASNSANATLTAVGGDVVVSSISSTSPAFTVTGPTLPLTLPAGQSASFAIHFSPQAAGAASGQIGFVTNASASPILESLSGTGAEAAAHSASLTWAPEETAVAGYNVYRSTQSGGPYTKINAALNATPTFVDGSVEGGQTYFYVVTAVDSAGDESPKSNEAQAIIPTN